jgi:hypothetical protein
MKHFDLPRLLKIRKELINEGLKDSELMQEVLESIEYKESLMVETSATGGLSVGSAGNVSAQPSGLAGTTIGTNWASGGGTEGGYISTPYNPSGSNRIFQKLPAPMGKEHGPRTGKKSRQKRLDLKALKSAFAKRQDYTGGEGEVKKDKKVLDFNDFMKNDFNTIKK